MVSKKAIIGVVVVLVVAVLVIAVAGGGSSSDKKADVRYDYTAEFIDSVHSPTSSAVWYPEGEGMKFLLVHITIANDFEEDGVSTNELLLDVKATYDHITYNQSAGLASFLPGYQYITIQQGGVGTTSAVIEVPDEATLDEISVTVDLDFSFTTFERDDSLL